MAMPGFIRGLIDMGASKVKNFLGGASDFINMTPKYLDEGYEKSFAKMIKKNNSELMSKYGSEFGDVSYSSLSLQDRNKIYSNFKKDVRQTNAFNMLDYDKFEVGNQKHLQDVYEAMNDTGFKDAYMQRQIELGKRCMFGSKFKNFDFSDGGKNLNEAQLGALSKEFDIQYSQKIDNFNKMYVADGTPNYNYGLQQRYLGGKSGSNLSASFFGKNKNAKRNNKLIRKGGKQGEALGAYKEYLSGKLNDIPEVSNDILWTPPESFYDYASKEFGMSHEQAKMVSKQIAMGDPDHSGINIWQKAKDHPVIATSLVMGTAWGISELTENDSF